MTRTDNDMPLVIVFGGDVGAYTLGLEAYEAFGCRPVCVAHEPVALITKSKIFDVVRIEAQASDSARLAAIRKLAEQHPARRIILLANNDALIAFFARNRGKLGSEVIVPFPSEDIVELLSSKEGFAQVCEKVGVPTPPSLSVELRDPQEGDWAEPEIPFRFPVVAKADASDQYERIQFEGKQKVYFIDTPEELSALWNRLRSADYQGTFLVQELIPGDDTHKRTVSMYVDSQGRVTLRAAAQVLLEDPTPTMVGNPAAMISRSMPDLWEKAELILKELDYRGFANFDLKVDPRDGTPYFFELNPRAGRSSYFIVAGGHNPIEIMGDDLLHGKKVKPVEASRHALYTLLPLALILRYVKERTLRREVLNLARRRRVINPLWAKVENDPKRRLVVWAQGLNHFRKFHRYYRSDL